MTSLFARNERLLWRTRFSTTEMPSQFLTQYNTIKSWQFSLFSLKLSLQSAVCRLHGMQSADCTVQSADCARFPDCTEHCCCCCSIALFSLPVRGIAAAVVAAAAAASAASAASAAAAAAAPLCCCMLVVAVAAADAAAAAVLLYYAYKYTDNA